MRNTYQFIFRMCITLCLLTLVCSCGERAPVELGDPGAKNIEMSEIQWNEKRIAWKAFEGSCRDALDQVVVSSYEVGPGIGMHVKVDSGDSRLDRIVVVQKGNYSVMELLEIVTAAGDLEYKIGESRVTVF